VLQRLSEGSSLASHRTNHLSFHDGQAYQIQTPKLKRPPFPPYPGQSRPQARNARRRARLHSHRTGAPFGPSVLAARHASLARCRRGSRSGGRGDVGRPARMVIINSPYGCQDRCLAEKAANDREEGSLNAPYQLLTAGTNLEALLHTRRASSVRRKCLWPVAGGVKRL
jgi:hypothetical protein